MYGFGVYSGFIFAASGYRELPGMAVLLTGFAIPALILLFKEPVLSIIHKYSSSADDSSHENGNHSPITVIMEWVVELLEIFSGYLANTLSFMRVAGLGIAHVSLMMAFDQIAVNVFGSIFHPGGMLIYILGNALVIALEGLSAGIQSLRLNYYEFFSKYFSGSGKSYMPISLKDRLYNKEI